MDVFFTAAALSFGVVFLGEMGDKSQLMALSLAARYKLSSVVAGLVIATAILFGVSVGIGTTVGSLLPTDWIKLGAAVLFIAFGLWSLRPEDEEQHEIKERKSGLLTVVGAVILAEIGDKTMLFAIGLGSQYNPWGVWLGATAGMVAADLLAVFAGAWIAARIPERFIRWGAAVIFIVLGLALGVEAVRALAG
ncbi:TMEM165/GDT1 family protein [Glycomyces sp. L485]|uniref:TMEM165/GDT1 family protein n=1 Tax=Glycomyces sp. L485 TaxID=2909235 RepID=UPI001F4B075C|nr:TMEM165/GDT1 family protein [Glycomyces sp. L485]MCH7231930.1 TMEM165/GDT1 family protein [Glycomyces sp. L485]